MRFRFQTSRSQGFTRFFGQLPLGSRLVFYAAVFCCFAPIGLLTDAGTLGRTTPTALAIMTLYSGGIGALYAGLAIARITWMPLAIVVHLALSILVPRLFPLLPDTQMLDRAAMDALQHRLQLLTVGSVALMALAYTLFLTLFQREGQRFAGAQTEIRLAREIHRTLVPDVRGRDAAAEWLGRSLPSGEVGGDLVDVITSGDRWWGVIADVTGHGVAAGVMMGMFKTALHAHVAAAETPGELLSRVNATLDPLRQPNMFVTAACLRRRSETTMELALAGHPPLLHLQRATGTMTWVGEPQLAIGFADGAAYTTATLSVASGDLLVVLTDGLVEVFDKQDRELGAEGLERALAALPPDAALAEVDARIFDTSRAHGPQLDDQTVLLVRIS